MKTHLRLILLTISNSGLFAGFILAEKFIFGDVINKTLLDLKLEESGDSKIIFIFLGMIVLGVVVNLALMYQSSRRVNTQIAELAMKLRAKSTHRPSESAS